MHSGRPFKGLIVARCKAVITEWVNVQFKRDLIGRQRLHIEQAVRNWDSAVCRGMPQKRRRRIRPNLFVAGKFSNFRLQNRKELTLANVCFLWYNTF